MEKFSALSQTWYNLYIDLLALKRKTESINQLTTKVSVKESYFAEELDEIVHNKKSVDDHKIEVEKKQQGLREQGEEIVDLLLNLGVPAGASISCSVKTKDDVGVSMNVWYHKDHSFGNSFGL